MKKFNLKFKYHSQRGVTLLLAIVILSSVMAISFSLATILFIEVRTSGDLLKTEGALYAAGGVGEEAFFNIKRQVPADTYNYTTNFSNNVKLSGAPVTTTNSTPIVQDKVLRNSYFGSVGQKIYDFCNTDVSAGGCGYGKVDVTFLDTGGNGSIRVYLCEFDPNTNYGGEAPCSNLSTTKGYWRNATGDVLDKNNSLQSYTFLNSAKQQVLYVTNTNTSVDAYFQIKTYQDTAGNIPKGLPYVGKTAVEVNAVNTSVGRKIRVVVPNSDANAGGANTVNYAAAINGGLASASTEYSTQVAALAIDGDRAGISWGWPTFLGGWNDGTYNAFPDWLQVAFQGNKSLSEVDVYTLANSYPTTPTATTPADLFGITDFQVQYDNGSGWQVVPGGNVTGNTLAWRKFTFGKISNVSKIRVYITNAPASYSRIVEVEAY